MSNVQYSCHRLACDGIESHLTHFVTKKATTKRIAPVYTDTMRRATLTAMAFCIVILIATLMTAPAQAQAETPTPEPTITPTPAYIEAVSLTSGNTLIIERTITYGDVAIVLVLLILLAMDIITIAFTTARGDSL